MRYLSWLITLPILLALINFALANRNDVTVSFWPFDAEVTLPLSVLLVGMLFLGLLLGSFVAWLASLKHRFHARRLSRELARLYADKATALPESLADRLKNKFKLRWRRGKAVPLPPSHAPHIQPRNPPHGF